MSKRSRIEELKNIGWGYEEIAELLKELKTELSTSKGKKRKENADEVKFEKRLDKILKKMDCPFKMRGATYIQEAVLYLHRCDNKDISEISITYEIYPEIAQKYNTTSAAVQSCIRDTINKMFMQRNLEIDKVFGICYSKPSGMATNTEFIFGLYECLKDK